MSDATIILERMAQGDGSAAEALFPLVYDHLRALAGNYFRGQRPDQTLQPTALVHEAYLKLIAPREGVWKDREHFLAIAATAMRQILSDHARRRKAAKRGGNDARERVTLCDLADPISERQVDLLALNEVLETLAALDARQARIVELRFFGGLTTQEIATFFDVSTRTIEKEWRRTRAWLSAELSERDRHGS